MYTKKEINYFLIILMTAIVTSCCKNPKLQKNGFTKNVKNIVVHIIKIRYDSLNNLVRDTIALREISYNKNGKINRQIQKMLFIDERIEVEFIYNAFNKLEKEIVFLSQDSSTFVVDYFYKDTLLLKTISETKKDEYQFSQISKYNYHPSKKLKNIVTSQIYVNSELNDTLQNSIELNKYNDSEFFFETEIINYKDSTKNKKYKYKYKCNKMVAEMKEYNHNNVLISKTKFKYQFDEFGNWIEKKFIENDTLRSITVREMKY